MSLRIKKYLYVILVLASTLTHSVDASESVKTDRYTLMNTDVQTEQKMPLTTITHFTLGREIITVGDAINEVLKGSGYRWQSPNGQDDLLTRLPLPAIVRDMGPVRIEDALKTIAGQVWSLQCDHLNRVVWFETKSVSITSNQE